MRYVEKSRFVKFRAYISTLVGNDTLPLQDICHILRKDMLFTVLTSVKGQSVK